MMNVQKGSKSVEEATQRVKQRMPIEKVREIPKFKDITKDEYEKLMKDAETIALIVLKIVFAEG